MLSLDDLRRATINEAVAKEAYDQSEKAMTDLLETKKGLEGRAASLLTAYVTVALAVMGLACVLLKQGLPMAVAFPFFIVGTLYAAGAVCFALVQDYARYGTLGSQPKQWLNAGTIDGADAALAANWAYLTFYRQARIESGNAANAAKARALRLGLVTGACAPLVFLVVPVIRMGAW